MDPDLSYSVKRRIGIVVAAAGLFLIGISAPPNELPDFKAFVFVFSAMWLCLLHKDFGLEKPGPYPWEFPVLRIALTLGSAAIAAFVPGCVWFVFITLLSVFCWYA